MQQLSFDNVGRCIAKQSIVRVLNAFRAEPERTSSAATNRANSGTTYSSIAGASTVTDLLHVN